MIQPLYQDNQLLTRSKIMNKANDDRAFFNHLQLPLGFEKTDPGDLKRVLAFLDDRSSADTPIFFSDVFSWFSGQSDAWSGGRFARSISTLFSDHMISCVMDGNTYLSHHSSIFLEAPDQWARIQVIPRKRLSVEELEEVVALCRSILGMDCLADQDELTHFLIGCLNRWKSSLTVFNSLAEAGRYPGAADIRSCFSFIQAWQSIADPYDKISFVRNAKAELKSFCDTFVRLKNFYEGGTARWDSGRKLIEKFIEFQSIIERDAEATSDLLKLRHVLEMEHPWNELDAMDALIARIKPVYERIRNERYSLLQHDTLLQIDRMIEAISQLLEESHARSDLRNVALVDLQKIKKAITLNKPDSHIFKQREIAEEAFEKAQDVVLSHI